MKAIILFIPLLLIFNTSYAKNYPCSGKKGGVERCSQGKFVCKDGSISSSKQKCTQKIKNTINKKVKS